MVSRVHYLAVMAPQITFQRVWKVSLLGGARPLDPVKERREVLCTTAELPFKEGWAAPEQMPTTEAEMMELTWQQSRLPSEWKYELVNTPLQRTRGKIVCAHANGHPGMRVKLRPQKKPMIREITGMFSLTRHEAAGQESQT